MSVAWLSAKASWPDECIYDSDFNDVPYWIMRPCIQPITSFDSYQVVIGSAFNGMVATEDWELEGAWFFHVFFFIFVTGGQGVHGIIPQRLQ